MTAKQSFNKSSDDQLIARARRGDERAFIELVRKYDETVYKFAFKLCRDKTNAEETMQDTFISMHRGLKSFNGRSKLSTWLYRIVSNHCLMKHRRRNVDAIMESYDEPVFAAGDEKTPRWNETPADILIKREFRKLLDKAILDLPMEYRIVFVLRDLEDRSTAETATIVGLSQEAVKSRLRRARGFLRDKLHPYMSHQRTLSS